MNDDLEYEDIQALLSRPAASIPGQVSRRAFLGGALATTGALTLLPSWMDGMAAAATPIGANDGILVVIQFGGGNDGLNTVVPMGTGTPYTRARGGLAITNPLPLADGLGFHPNLPKLKARYDAGQVAIVRGVGQSTVTDLSHFSSTATWMAGTSGADRTSGWLGRWLDGVSESADGLRAVQIGSSVPLHLLGRTSQVTALDTGGDLFGADRSEAWMTSVYDAVAAMGVGPTGKGQWADKVGASGKAAVDLAVRLSPMYSPELPDDSLASQLTLAARLINANLGIRVVNCAFGSFDTHDAESYFHGELMKQLDAGIDAFYATLASTWRRRTTLLTFSEFGRRVEANASGGTDHGTASVQFVIGDNVKGGMYGQQPSLTDLDDRGNLKVAVDYRSVYGSVLSGWFGADPAAILGSSYETLPLFAATPGKTPGTTPPPTTNPWRPFADPATLVRQQYLDFLGRAGDAGGVTYWANRLVAGTVTIPGVVQNFFASAEFAASVSPAARVALLGLGAPPAYDDLMAWAAMVRAKQPVADVAAQVVTKSGFTSRYGGLADRAFVTTLHQDATGAAAPASFTDPWVAKLAAKTATRADVLAAVSQLSAAVTRAKPKVDVLMTYVGMLRRSPDASGYTYWVGQVTKGTSITRLIAQFFASAEYRGRFE